jgi:hypothetical protein
MNPASPSFRDWFYKIQQFIQNGLSPITALGTGLIAKTGVNTYAAREIEGTANQITVTDGDGVAGNPVVSLPSAIVTPGSLTTTTNLTVNGNATIGDTGNDLLEVKSKAEFDLNLDSYVSIDGETSRTNGLGFFFGTLNYSNATAANYQIFTRPNVSVAKTNWRAVSIRCDSPVTSTGLISTVSGLEISGGPSWLGTSPTNWRQITIGDVSVATNTYGIYNSIASGTNKWGYYGIGTAPNYMEGALGIGIDNSTDSQIRISKAISGANTSYLGYYSGAVQSTVATSAVGMRVRMDTQAASFTLPLMTGFLASQGTIGATSAVTTQYGFHANSTLTGATNNYGFYSDIASSTGRWNFFANGSADNAFNGNVRIGSTVAPTVALDVTGSTNVSALTSLGTVARTAAALSTTAPAKLYVNPATFTDNTTASSGTVAHGTINSFDNPAIAATNTTVTYTNASTVYIDGAPTNGTNVTITNPYSLFVNAGATVHGGNNRFGGTTAPTVAVDVTGAVLATTSITSSGQTSGVGYSTGAGSTVTQGAGSGKATAVTLNRVCGQITMDSALLAAATAVSFTLNNSAISTTDVVIVNIDSGATTNSYISSVEAVGAGSCQIQLYNISALPLSEAVVLNFAVIKSVTS